MSWERVIGVTGGTREIWTIVGKSSGNSICRTSPVGRNCCRLSCWQERQAMCGTNATRESNDYGQYETFAKKESQLYLMAS